MSPEAPPGPAIGPRSQSSSGVSGHRLMRIRVDPDGGRALCLKIAEPSEPMPTGATRHPATGHPLEERSAERSFLPEKICLGSSGPKGPTPNANGIGGGWHKETAAEARRGWGVCLCPLPRRQPYRTLWELWEGLSENKGVCETGAIESSL
ncbi:hypothetical protein CMUS01_00898 [Colletotrichum musicola]|uniref:Uncharacterized protein n=1 Tax=Colletotrichum musicola TaxID=2175873 RepID=A0A8H6NY60_9PEZI|nr:hypothetical protein CMUS01_00898 [Colletotrichum musicola]